MEVKQVLFRDESGDLFAGILLDDDRIICGCCGGIFERGDAAIVKVFNQWADISKEIAEPFLNWQDLSDKELEKLYWDGR